MCLSQDTKWLSLTWERHLTRRALLGPSKCPSHISHRFLYICNRFTPLPYYGTGSNTGIDNNESKNLRSKCDQLECSCYGSTLEDTYLGISSLRCRLLDRSITTSGPTICQRHFQSLFVFFHSWLLSILWLYWIEKPIFAQKITQGDVDQAFCESKHILLHFQNAFWDTSLNTRLNLLSSEAWNSNDVCLIGGPPGLV